VYTNGDIPPPGCGVPPDMTGKWDAGLFECSKYGCCNCWRAMWCACCVHGEIAQASHNPNTSCSHYFGLGVLSHFLWLGDLLPLVMGGAPQRSRTMAHYGIPERDECCGSACCTYFWCQWCAQAQELHQIKKRGWWTAPVPAPAAAPAVHQHLVRPSFSITVPAGALPGQVLSVESPNGQPMQVRVPDGAKEGTQIMVS